MPVLLLVKLPVSVIVVGPENVPLLESAPVKVKVEGPATIALLFIVTFLNEVAAAPAPVILCEDVPENINVPAEV